MIRAEQIKSMTPKMIKALTPQATLEYMAERREFGNEQVYAVYDGKKLLMILGVMRRSMLMPAEIWVLLGKAYGTKYARESKRVVDSFIHKYGGLYTLINIDLAPACRFAKFFGFRPRGPIINHGDQVYQLFEVYP